MDLVDALVRGSGFRVTLTWSPDSGASMSSFKRSQAKYVKQTHKITNGIVNLKRSVAV